MKIKEEYLLKTTQIIALFNEHLESVSKLKLDQFKDTYLIYVVLPNTILNIRINDKIIVDIDNKLNQLTLDFYKNEKSFDNVRDFTTFFRSLHSSLIDRDAGIYVTYKGQEILCYVEVSSIDSDRQMGPEVIYEIKFYDEEIEDEVIAVEVSEYPMGSFNIFNSHDDIEFNEREIIDYFYSQNNEPPFDCDDF